MKSPFTLVHREFARYLYGDAQTSWRVAETPKRRTVESADLMAHNGFHSVIVTYMGQRTFRVTIYTRKGRCVGVVVGATKVYEEAVRLLDVSLTELT